MRKLIAICIAITSLLFFSNNTIAQFDEPTPHFAEGQIDVNVGLGLFRTFYTGLNTSIPPISISGEYGVSQNIGIGGYIGYTSAKQSFTSLDVKYNFTIIGLRGSYHVHIIDELDTYGGIMIGYNRVNANYKDEDPFFIGFDPSASSDVYWSAYLGARYPFSDDLSAFGEIGYGIAWLNLGVSFKM